MEMRSSMPKGCCNSPACQNRTRLMRHAASIPHIPLVPFEAVGLEEAAVFVLEGVLGVVLFLVGDVGADVVDFGFADGEDAVAGLPVEFGEHRIALAWSMSQTVEARFISLTQSATVIVRARRMRM